MSQQYYYNSAQYTTPTSYAGQSVNACYAAAVAQPLTSGYTAATQCRTGLGTTYNVTGSQISSAHRSQAPVTYTYPSNATVIAPPIAVVPGQQTTLVAPSIPTGKVGPVVPSFVIANGPTSAQQNTGPYTVTTSYFQQIPGQAQVQKQSMAQALAAAQQANFHVAMVAANSNRGGRNFFDGRFQNFRKSGKIAGRPNIDNQVFYCDVCKISCAGPQTYKEHLGGQKHKKKASGSTIVPSTAVKCNQRQLRCELCDVICTGVDSYQGHIKGFKHMKTVKLHQKLGKPIPCVDPLIIKAVPIASSETNGDLVTGTVKVAVGTKINFINASTLKTVTDDSVVAEKTVPRLVTTSEEHVDLNSLQDKSVVSVGSEYIETTTNDSGKVIQFFCKLCSCTFNDPHAKDMHLKGRRHRLQFKRKVDPSLVVEIKPGTTRNWKWQEDRTRTKQEREEFWKQRDMQTKMREMQLLEYSNLTNNIYQNIGHSVRSFDTLDDRHMSTKHNSIYPTDEEYQIIQAMVSGCEKALRQISEQLFDEVVKDTDSLATEVKKEDTPKTGEKLLIGSMRVGPLAKAILLRGEMVVSLVLLCSKWPTFSLMSSVVDKLPTKLDELLPNDNIEVSLNEAYQCILVSRKKTPETHCYIHFTSSVVREESPSGAVAVQPEDGLDRKRCLDALASLRHTKWFQAKVSNRQPCLALIQILRDLCQRVSTWTPLSSWAIELLVEKVVSSDPMTLSLGSALRRFFECVSSGILLKGSPGLRDPCEKEISDASAVLTDQDREDITSSAQHALRLIAFRQIHKVLAMEPVMADNKATSTVRKRRHSDEGKETVDPYHLKKEKMAGENGEGVVIETEVVTAATVTV